MPSGLRPIAEKVIDQAFNEAISKAAAEKEALDMARERVTQLYNCRLAEGAFFRRALAEALAEVKLATAPTETFNPD